MTLLKYSSGCFRVLTHSSSSNSSSSGSRRDRHGRVWLQTFCCLPPSVCRSILTSNVWNNEINIKLLNISVHSRSKVEVFFLTDLAPPPNPLPTPSTNALCSAADPIHHPASGGRGKALSQGGCFLVLPALLFQRAPGRPG